jgi:hypothetical protein
MPIFGFLVALLFGCVLATVPRIASAQTVVHDVGGNISDETIQMFLERAKQRPDFNEGRACAGDVCQTIASATREPSTNADGNISYGQDVFIKYDRYPDHIVWCYRSLAGGSTHYRSCQQAPNFMWIEAYLPHSKLWQKIDTNDASCSVYRLSKYDIDDAYVDCMVRKLDRVAAR